MKLLTKVVVTAAAVVFAVSALSKPALAEASCSQPWLPQYCDSGFFEICIPGYGCTWNEVQFNGIRNES